MLPGLDLVGAAVRNQGKRPVGFDFNGLGTCHDVADDIAEAVSEHPCFAFGILLEVAEQGV